MTTEPTPPTPHPPTSTAPDFTTRTAHATAVLRTADPDPQVVRPPGSATLVREAARDDARTLFRGVAAGAGTTGIFVVLGLGLDSATTASPALLHGVWATGLIAVLVVTAGIMFGTRPTTLPGWELHGHAAAAYNTLVDAPRRLRELGASEHAAGRVEELGPVAEYLAGTLAELRAQLVADGDPAGDTTGTPAHEQLLTLAGEAAAIVDLAREARRSLAAATYASLPVTSLADVADDIAAETSAARQALDRLG